AVVSLLELGLQRGWDGRPMRRVIAVAVLLAAFAVGAVVGGWKSEISWALKTALGLPDRTFGIENRYYRARSDLFRQFAGDADAVMLGDSNTEWVDWHELFPGVQFLNRGIAGDTSAGVLNRLDEVIGRHPKVVFLMIGINDLQARLPISEI